MIWKGVEFGVQGSELFSVQVRVSGFGGCGGSSPEAAVFGSGFRDWDLGISDQG